VGRSICILPTNVDYAKLCRRALTKLGKKDAVNLIDFRSLPGKQRTSSRSPGYTFFVSRLADISEEAAKKTRGTPNAKYLLFSEGMPIEALAPRLARLDIRDAKLFHLAHERGEEVFGVIHRLLRGLSQTDDGTSIVDAWLEDQNLVVLSPFFERLTVPLHQLSKFLGTTHAAPSSFEIDDDGSFLYWERADVHLGWDQLLQLVDPAALMVAKAKTAEFNCRYGAAIRSLRDQAGLKQADIAGLTDRHLRRIEQGEQGITKTALEALASAHQMEVGQYMNELARLTKS
jgi:hypothetical protein